MKLSDRGKRTGTSIQGAQSVNRALDALLAICEAENGIALGDLSEVLGLHKATTHRLVRSLVTYRFVTQDPETKKYRAGLKLFELARTTVDKLELRSQALPELSDLSRKTEETVHLAVLDDGEVVYIDKRETQHTIRMYSAVGKRGPAHCTGVGKVLLAYSDPEEVRRVVKQKGLKRFTENTITELAALERHLARVRERGYAIDDCEHEAEIRCAACPIRDHTGRVVAAVSVTVPSLRATKEQVKALVPHVVRAAATISQKMGFVGPVLMEQRPPERVSTPHSTNTTSLTGSRRA